MAASGRNKRTFRLAVLDRSGLPGAQALTAALGWPHRIEDWRWALALGEGLG